MSPRLKAFLKRHGRFPKKGELRSARRSSGRRLRGSHRRRMSRAASGRRHFSMGRRHRRRGRHSFKIPVISTAILAGQVLTAWEIGGHTIHGAADQLTQMYTGYSPMYSRFEPSKLIEGYGPWL